jgi:sterol 3beta-glucosyltransferase
MPIFDIIGVFYAGLYVLTREESEVWFEFRITNTRNECLRVLNEYRATSQASSLSATPDINLSRLRSPDYRRYSQSWQLLEELHRIERQFPDKISLSQDQLNVLPPLASPSSAIVLAAKPLRITCLTIGTRGDVQPYIALCKVFIW